MAMHCTWNQFVVVPDDDTPLLGAPACIAILYTKLGFRQARPVSQQFSKVDELCDLTSIVMLPGILPLLQQPATGA